MTSTERTATPSELAQKYRHLSWFEFGARRIAREEANRGVVAVSMFEVRRVWSCISCSGPPCCPATWLIETSEREYVEMSSWEHLLPVEEKFPGRRVTATYWPSSRRIIHAAVEGETITTEPESEEARNFGGYNEFRLVALSDVPLGLTHAGASIAV